MVIPALGVAAVGLLERRAHRRSTTPSHPVDRAAHSEDLEGTEHVLESHDGARLRVTVAGPPDGPVVVLAHCWTGSQETWAPVARRLVAEGCCVVRWDQRGHGRSHAGHKGHTIEGLGDDLASVIAGLDLREVVLAGHSLGGMTVQSFATHHPRLFAERTKGVVLVATAAHSLRGPVTGLLTAVVAHRRVEQLLRRPGAGALAVRGTFGRRAHPHHLEATRADFVATAPRVRREFLYAASTMDLREGIATITVPTTVLVGTLDTLTPLPLGRSLAATIPGARLEVLAGLGHMLPYEAPDVVTAATLAHVG